MIDWSHYDGIITNLVYDEEALRFKTIAEFKDCMHRGGEVMFEWNGIDYTCCSIRQNGERYYSIAQCGTAEVNRTTTKRSKTVDEMLEYMVGDDRLRDMITQVTVIDRTL